MAEDADQDRHEEASHTASKKRLQVKISDHLKKYAKNLTRIFESAQNVLIRFQKKAVSGIKTQQQKKPAPKTTPGSGRDLSGSRRAGAWIIFEGLAVLALVVIGTLGLGIWRLTSGPVNVSFAGEDIEQVLEKELRLEDVEVGQIWIDWPDLLGQIHLTLNDVRLQAEKGDDAFAARQMIVEISRSALFAGGRIKPYNLTLIEPALQIVHTKEGRWQAGIRGNGEDTGTGEPERVSVEDTDRNIPEILNAWIRQDDAAGILAHLRSFRIIDAHAFIEDKKAGVVWRLPSLDLELAHLKDEEGLGLVFKTEMSPSGPAAARPVIRGQAVYMPGTVLGYDLEWTGIDPFIYLRRFEVPEFLEVQSLRFSGRMAGTLDKNLKPEDIELELRSEQGELLLSDLYSDPLAFRDLNIQGKIDLKTRRLNIAHIAAKIRDIPLNGQADISYDPGARTAVMSVTANIDESNMAAISAAFPPALEGQPAHKWVVRKLSNGTVRKLAVHAKTAFTLTDDDDLVTEIDDLTASMSFENMDIDYSPPLMPAKGARGEAAFDYRENSLHVIAETAKIGDMNGSEIDLVFDDFLTVGGGEADLNFRLKGPLRTVFEYIASEPIDLGGTLGLPPEKIGGAADLGINVRFPTVKDLLAEQVKVKVDGALNNLVLPGLIEGLDLTGGPAKITVADGAFSLRGDAELDGRPVKMDWRQYIDPDGKPWQMKVDAELAADEALRTHFGVDLSDFISGTFPLSLSYTERDDTVTDIAVQADLTSANVFFEPLAYNKAPGLSAGASARIRLENGQIQELTGLSVSGPSLRIENGNLVFGLLNGVRTVRSGTLPVAGMGRSELSVKFEITPDSILEIEAKGPVFDAAPVLEKDKTESADEEKAEREPSQDIDDSSMPLIVSGTFGRMITTEDSRAVSDVALYMRTDTQDTVTQLEMDAVAGEGAIYLRYKPDETGQMHIRLEADDAGAALSAFDLYDDIKGGTLTIRGEPMGETFGGDLTGKAVLENFRVVEAPVLARLLNALSLQGIVDLMNNEGLAFTRLETGFDWLARPAGSILVIRNGRTSGASIGLTIEGAVDRSQDRLDLSGTIVPVSGLNRLMGNIPILGDLLAGGRGGAVFAATYTARGPAKAPDIAINPLAALAPGILRKIFFEGGE